MQTIITRATTTTKTLADKTIAVFLTNKSMLPVKELRFEDTGHVDEKGYHTLGKLKRFLLI